MTSRGNEESPESVRGSVSQPSDRRMGRRLPPRSDRRMQRSRDQRDPRKQRLVIIVGVAILLIIGGIVGYGYYDQFVAPPRVLAARVGSASYTQGDLVNRMRLLQRISVSRGQQLDLGSTPFRVLMNMAEAEMIRRAAPAYNIQVNDDEVELAIRVDFYPRVPEGQEVSPQQIESEYKENYQRFLESAHLSDRDYRRILKENLFRARMRAELGGQVPSVGEHVEVHWIKLDAGAAPSPLGAPAVSPEQVRARLDNEEFADVAREASRDRRYADEKGYVGWVAKGAFPDLDAALFGSEKQDPIVQNEISRPISTVDAVYIIKVTAGPEEREFSEVMKGLLTNHALDMWLNEQRDIGTKEGWLEMKFSSKVYYWVIDQLGQSAPRTTPPPSGQS